MSGTAVTLGDDVDTGQPVTVDQVSLCSGSYILGVQGTGKSSLLEQIASQQLDLGEAVIVFDAHGDLVEDIIRRLPASRLPDTYLLDLEDCRQYPFGLNVFVCRDSSNEKARDRTRNLVVHAFEKLWPETKRAQYFPLFLNGVTMTLIELPRLTLRHVRDLLDDPVFRQHQVAAVKDFDAREFWRDYERMTPSTRNTESAPFRKRLAELRRDTIVRLLLFQPRHVIDIKQAIEQRQVLLIKLPVNIPEYRQTAQTVGTLLMALVYAATFSFGELPETKRPGFTLLVDEFQEFATDEFAELFTQGRKFKVKQFLAHQQRGQLDEAGMVANKPATLTAYTRVAFRLNEPDARELASAFVDLDDRRRPVNLAIDILPRLKTHPAPAVKDFALQYVRPLEAGTTDRIGACREWVPPQSDSRRDKGWVTHTPVYPRSDFGCGVVSFLPEYVAYAFDVLNEYLYYAQKHGRPAPDRRKQLLATFAPLLRFPAVAALAFPEVPVDKTRWAGDDWATEYRQAAVWDKTQWPWAQQEAHYRRFLHDLNMCVRELLRQPLTVRDSAAGQADAKDSLQKLDQQMAYVKLGSQTCAMQTLDLAQTAPAVSETEYQHRRQLILTQTRARYCRPRAEVEAELRADGESPDTPAPAKETPPPGKETPPPAQPPPPLPKAAQSPKAPRIQRSRPSSDHSGQP